MSKYRTKTEVTLNTSYSMLDCIVDFDYTLDFDTTVYTCVPNDSREDIYDFLDRKYQREIDEALVAYIEKNHGTIRECRTERDL